MCCYQRSERIETEHVQKKVKRRSGPARCGFLTTKLKPLTPAVVDGHRMTHAQADRLADCLKAAYPEWTGKNADKLNELASRKQNAVKRFKGILELAKGLADSNSVRLCWEEDKANLIEGNFRLVEDASLDWCGMLVIPVSEINAFAPDNPSLNRILARMLSTVTRKAGFSYIHNMYHFDMEAEHIEEEMHYFEDNTEDKEEIEKFKKLRESFRDYETGGKLRKGLDAFHSLPELSAEELKGWLDSNTRPEEGLCARMYDLISEGRAYLEQTPSLEDHSDYGRHPDDYSEGCITADELHVISWTRSDDVLEYIQECMDCEFQSGTAADILSDRLIYMPHGKSSNTGDKIREFITWLGSIDDLLIENQRESQ